MTEGLTSQAVQEAMAKIELVGAVKKSAKRVLNNLHGQNAGVDPEDEDNQRLVAAFRSLGISYVKLDVFQHWKATMTYEEVIDEDIFLVSRARMPNLNTIPELQKWIIPPEDIVGKINKDSWWFVDECAKEHMHLMGGRVKHWKCGVKLSWSSTRGDGPLPLTNADEAASSARSVQEVVPETAVPENRVLVVTEPATQTDDGSNTPTKRVALCERPSDPEDSDIAATTQMAKDAHQCHQEEKYYDSDPLNPHTLEFKVRMYAGYICKQAQNCQRSGRQLSDVIRPHMRVFLKYVVDWLLQGNTFEIYKFFIPHFERVAAVDPSLVPTTVSVMTRIASLPLIITHDKDDLQLQDMGLDLKQLNHLTTSGFYGGFEVKRKQATYDHVKGSHGNSESRLQMIELLLGKDMSTEEANALAFAKTVLTTEERALLKKYLIETSQSFDLLKVWFPKHEMHVLFPLHKEHTIASVKKLQVEDVMKAAHDLLDDEAVDDSIANPVLRTLVQDTRKIRAITKELPEKTFTSELLRDLFACKLGVEGVSEPTLVGIDTMGEALLKLLFKIIDGSSVCRRSAQGDSFAALKALYHKCVSAAQPDEGLASAKADVLASAKDNVGAAEKDEAFQEGDFAYVTHAVQRKDKYLNYKGTVVRVTAATLTKPAMVTLIMLDGPKKNTKYERPPDCLSKTCPVVPLAGQKQALQSASSDGSAVKKLKTAQDDISAIFGAPPPEIA